MRPILRPGTHVLTRGSGEVQVGLDPGTALVLPDSDTVRGALRRLATPAGQAVRASGDGGPDPHAATIALLDEHDLVMDQGALTPLLTPRSGRAAEPGDDHDPADHDPADRAAAALARSTGTAAPGLRASRERWRCELRGFGHPAGHGLREQFAASIRTAGLREVGSRGSAPADGGVLLGVGEPDREALDAWTRAGTPYLLVRMTEGRAVIGPFVVPGRTACLRCVDAHYTDADPAWPLLVRQYALAAGRDRADGAPEPLDPLLGSLAVAWAARDLVTYVDGGRPSTWSATVTLHPQLDDLEKHTWLRHAACCCTWD